ncbi:MAG: type II toxin-antitoxin system prevent-host-death family antitoxin [Calditrichaeota bacterium]|nr:type II toxin-antitoxin system prevent-host-death family antitoxin [Calditrichota bacterium]MCB0305476.1 type II toxin-antitoxin system prevent-host-death family antitoxin [Calditrichota bacterium]MCB9089411.1 type II toxin-antitoxin system prevent-host-death family antitoxin [Calditrichia bacterium]
MKATAKDLRFYSKELLETVARGEEVIITYRGKPFAKLVPLDDADYDSDTNIELFGIWADYTEIEAVDEYVRELRKGRF